MSDIFYTPPASSGGTTINQTNNVIPVRNNATTFIDSVLFNDTNSLSTNNSFGFSCDFSTRIFNIGDYQEGNNATYLKIDDANQLIGTINQGNQKGLKLDFGNNLYKLGDFDNINKGHSFWIDDNNGLIRTYSFGQRNGLQFDFGAQTYLLGDFDTINKGTAILIEDNNENITFRANNQITFQGNNLQDNNPRTYTGRNIVVFSPSGGTYYLPLYQ